MRIFKYLTRTFRSVTLPAYLLAGFLVGTVAGLLIGAREGISVAFEHWRKH